MNATPEPNRQTTSDSAPSGAVEQPADETAAADLRQQLLIIRDYRTHMSQGNNRMASVVSGMCADFLELEARVTAVLRDCITADSFSVEDLGDAKDAFELMINLGKQAAVTTQLQARLLDPGFFADPIRRHCSGIQR